jgi:hypothetical protein
MHVPVALFLAIAGFVTAIVMPALALARLNEKSMAAETALSETGIAFLVLGVLLFFAHQGAQSQSFFFYLFFFISFSMLRQSFFFMLVKDLPSGHGIRPVMAFNYLLPALLLWPFFGFFELAFFYQHASLGVAMLLFLGVLLNRFFFTFGLMRLFLCGESQKPGALFSALALGLNLIGVIFPWVESWLGSLFLGPNSHYGGFGVFVSIATLLSLAFLLLLEASPPAALTPDTSSHALLPFVKAYFLSLLKRTSTTPPAMTILPLDGFLNRLRLAAKPLLSLEQASVPALLFYYALLWAAGLLCLAILR